MRGSVLKPGSIYSLTVQEVECNVKVELQYVWHMESDASGIYTCKQY